LTHQRIEEARSQQRSCQFRHQALSQFVAQAPPDSRFDGQRFRFSVIRRDGDSSEPFRARQVALTQSDCRLFDRFARDAGQLLPRLIERPILALECLVHPEFKPNASRQYAVEQSNLSGVPKFLQLGY